jgi:hypothetical protein
MSQGHAECCFSRTTLRNNKSWPTNNILIYISYGWWWAETADLLFKEKWWYRCCLSSDLIIYNAY